jgi:large subunit ribosomal protein L32e
MEALKKTKIKIKKTRRKPKFLKQTPYAHKRLKKVWRRPRGRQSKMRRDEKGKAAMPDVGWRTPRLSRGLHPSGLREVIVHNAAELARVDAKKEAARIASAVGKKKRAGIVEKAKELNIKILNAGIGAEKIEKMEKKEKTEKSEKTEKVAEKSAAKTEKEVLKKQPKNEKDEKAAGK